MTSHVFDEVQNSPRTLTSLKYFCEEAREYHVVAAGSLLGIQVGQSAPFPVGKVTYLDLYPMSFPEFLVALGKDNLRAMLEESDASPLALPFHNALLDLLGQYYYVGGMPEAVRSYAADGDLTTVRHIQGDILAGFGLDFSKYTTSSEATKLAATLQSIPRQLAREHKKFRYGEVRKGARSRDFRDAIQWLVAAGHGQLYYWTSKNTAEVDFLLTLDGDIVPLEVKAGVNRQKKSLRVYTERYAPTLACRSTLLNFRRDGDLCNYPLYALWRQ